MDQETSEERLSSDKLASSLLGQLDPDGARGSSARAQHKTQLFSLSVCVPACLRRLTINCMRVTHLIARGNLR